MPIITRLENLNLYKCTTRGYQLRWTSKDGDKIRHQVPADLQSKEKALQYAIDKSALVKHGLMKKNKKCKPLKEHLGQKTYYMI